MKLFRQFLNTSKLLLSNRPANSLKYISELLIGQFQPKVVSLNWGSHHQEHCISHHIKACLLETSPNIVLSVEDQVIEGLIHRHAFSDRAIYRLHDATFDPSSGDVYLGSKLVLESHSASTNLGFRRTSRTRNLHERPVIGVPFQTHYHWLIETLPRIIAATQFEPTALLVAPTRLSAMQREAIGKLGQEVIYTNDRYQSDNFILATRSRDSGWAHPRDLQTLRRFYEVPSKIGANYIFVSRISSSRSDSISIAMHECAVNTGWNVVLAEELTYTEHLDLFGGANVIAGEHGAGLANIALAPTGTRLIEFVNTSYANPCFNTLSLVLNGSNDYYSSHSRIDFEDVLRASRQLPVEPINRQLPRNVARKRIE